ncbi:MAG TPA: diaminopimelate epimerase, partial [Phycisphaerae bacterium]|nr:diaminopimelate epimerase [Phycisphaerae bacterium]
MRFTKMHGAGNDYVYVDCFAEPVPDDPAETARRVSDRHFGVGGDGLILIRPSESADARMQMFNADGSEAEMCGNGVRCLAKYVYDHGICRNETLKIETGAGVLSLDLEIVDGKVHRVRVDMGEPILTPADIPTTLPGTPAADGHVVDTELSVGGRELCVTCVSMGNPHCVTFVDEPTDDWVLGIGPQIETDPHFPNRVNAEFVKVLSPGEVRLRV